MVKLQMFILILFGQKQTYRIFAGPFTKKEEALKTIKNSLNKAFKYFNENKESFSHIAHPVTNTNTGYYGGIWSKVMIKTDRVWLITILLNI